MAEQGETLRLLPPATRFILQCGREARDRAGVAFGLSMPEAACRAEAAAGRAALWLGPDERLLLAPDGTGDAVAGALEAALAGLPHSLVDITGRFNRRGNGTGGKFQLWESMLGFYRCNEVSWLYRAPTIGIVGIRAAISHGPA